MSDDTQHAACYPPNELYEDWKQHAEELDMAVSEFMISMTEAGRKKIEIDVTPDETADELRQERNQLKQELADAKDQIERLERQQSAERREILEYIEETPNPDFRGVVEHLAKKTPERVRDYLETMSVDLEPPAEVEGEGVVFAYNPDRESPFERSSEQ